LLEADLHLLDVERADRRLAHDDGAVVHADRRDLRVLRVDRQDLRLGVRGEGQARDGALAVPEVETDHFVNAGIAAHSS
jgi:hypothetical protein